jgi:sulfonate transport system substrate-binding protein
LRIANPIKALWQWRRLRAFSWMFAIGLGLTLFVAACSANAPTGNSVSSPTNQAQVLRVGYQKSAGVLSLLKKQATLEKRLQPQGIQVEWAEFAAGPQMLEALNVGSIDLAYTGETPPVFAQAAGAPLVYVAYEPVGGAAEAILVQKDSPIRSIADLKGKTIALNKGSNVHYLLVRALESAGLKYSDITPAFLPPGDARPAFEQGKVDAWVIWDPFQAAAETAIGARILVDGKDLVANRGFFLSTRSFVDRSPALLKELLEELKTTSAWAKNNVADVSAFLSSELGIDKAAIELAEKRRIYGVLPLTEDVVAGQQEIADTFYRLKLIPQQIKIADAVWQG